MVNVLGRISGPEERGQTTRSNDVGLCVRSRLVPGRGYVEPFRVTLKDVMEKETVRSRVAHDLLLQRPVDVAVTL